MFIDLRWKQRNSNTTFFALPEESTVFNVNPFPLTLSGMSSKISLFTDLQEFKNWNV